MEPNGVPENTSEHLIPNTNPKNPGTTLLTLVIILLSLAIAYLTYQNWQLNQTVNRLYQSLASASMPNQTVSLPTPTPDPTAEWKIYHIDELNLEFKLPPRLSRLGEIKIEETTGETGSVICANVPKSTSLFRLTVYAGGAGCSIDIFGVGGVSSDFEAGREGGFTDTNGYLMEDGKYYWLSSKKLGGRQEIPPQYVQLKTNPLGLNILKVKSMAKPDEYPPQNTPGLGYIGALINISHPVYPGFAVEMKLDGELKENLFDQILSTFRITN